MKVRDTAKRNKRSSSDKSDSASSYEDEDSSGEAEIELPKGVKRRRRLIEEDDHDNGDSTPPPPSPDHTYKTSDGEEDSDQERDWDTELETMLPCRGIEELCSSDDDDDDNDDDDSTVVPAGGKRGTTLSRAAKNLEGLMRVRGMSARESSMSESYQENIADRVTAYVRKHMFRVVKFISNEHMFGKAFKEVMDHECVANRDRVKFQMLYESVFNHALNSKRSTCEQAGKNIMMKELKRFKEEGTDMFSIDELQKMRRATTEREKKAFLWFYGTFLECVCGLKQWGMHKSTQLVSQASSSATKHGKLVTVSDEAFALLLFDNYNEKWLKAFQQEEQQRQLETPAIPQPRSGDREQSKKDRVKGKYTAQRTGHCKYGGWSREGMARYNEFYHLVKADRVCEHAMDMERELLNHCIALRRRGTNSEGGLDASDGGPAEDGLEPVEACWDLEL
jgi:hypothetical protein